jgi:hypothetical protein
VDVPLVPNVILDGVRVQVSPAGEDEDDKLTVPVNPPREATVIVEVPAAFVFALTLVGLALMLIPGVGPAD